MSHSIIPPSSAHIYGKPNGCTGWVLMSQQYPKLDDSQDAKEGSAAHEIAAELLNYYSKGVYSTKHTEFTHELASNGVVFNPEMFHCAEIYAGIVKAIMVSTGTFGDNLLIEQSVVMPGLHELSNGTLDCCLRADYIIHLFDFKYGYEVYEAYENWQLLSYLDGVLNHFNINGFDEKNYTVVFHIVQPRAYHVDGIHREWEFKLTDARGYFNILKGNIEKSLSVNPQCNTGTHCKHCDIKFHCTAYLNSCMSLFECVSNTTPVNMTPVQLSAQLTVLKIAERRIKDLYSATEEQATIVAKSTTGLPGYSIVSKNGNRVWNYDVKTIEALGDAFDTNLIKPREAITPAQAENLGVPKDVIKEYIKKPRIGFKLIKDKTNKAFVAFGSN